MPLSPFTRRSAPLDVRRPGQMQFEQVAGKWNGNDYPTVSLTRIRDGLGSIVALVFMTHMNVDFDGAANAYGPPTAGFDPLDTLEHAGKSALKGYYGLMAVDPAAEYMKVKDPKTHQDKVILFRDAKDAAGKNLFDIEADTTLADKTGKLPIKQKSGPYKGYYVSTTSRKNPNGSHSLYEQSHYLDAASTPFYATSYAIEQEGIGDGDFGVALRLDTFRTASFTCLKGEGHQAGSGAAKEHALGECSYKVLLDIGGGPKVRSQTSANNNFPTVFILFPGSETSRLWRLSLAPNALEFANFLATQAMADRHARGISGMTIFGRYGHDAGDGGFLNAQGIMDNELIRSVIGQSAFRITEALRPFDYKPEASIMSMRLDL